MAVQVKEIVIRAVLPNEKNSEASFSADKDAIVQDCVNQVMKILKKKNLR